MVRRRLVAEARDFFDVSCAVLLEIHEDEGRAMPVAASPATGVALRPLTIADLPPLDLLLRQRLPALLSHRAEASEIDRALGLDSGTGSGTALLLPMRAGSVVRKVLLLLDEEGRDFSEVEIGVAGSFAAAAAASLAQMRLAEEHAEQVAQQAALARAAKTLNESLDLNRVLVQICSEAASILDGDNAAIYRGDAGGLTIEAVHGIVARGGRLPRPAGRRPLRTGRPARPAADHQRLPGARCSSPTPPSSARCAAASPCRCTGTASCAACSRSASTAATRSRART